METTIDISELVTCEVGPEISVAGEGDRPMVVEVPWSGVVGAGGGIGKYSEGIDLPGLEFLFAISSPSVPESLRWVNLFPGRSM